MNFDIVEIFNTSICRGIFKQKIVDISRTIETALELA